MSTAEDLGAARVNFPPADMPDIETASEDYARRFAGPVGEYFLGFQAAIVLKMLEPIPNPAILEVGGGHAQLAVPLVQKGYQLTVTGSHVVCRRRLARPVPPGSFLFQTARVHCLPFADQSFDVVMAFRLLTHVEDWQRLLAEICRVAKGTIILDYPDSRSVNYFSEFLFGTKKAIEGNTRPFRLFRRREIVDALRAQGFGHAVLRPQFVFPMVAHRMMGSLRFTKCIEMICGLAGLRRLVGSPVILKATRIQESVPGEAIICA